MANSFSSLQEYFALFTLMYTGLIINKNLHKIMKSRNKEKLHNLEILLLTAIFPIHPLCQ